jgi:hypothetical protein
VDSSLRADARYNQNADLASILCATLPDWESRIVLPQLRLRLLRLCDTQKEDGRINDEFLRLLARVRQAQSCCPLSHLTAPDLSTSSLAPIDAELATYLHGSFHYLGSPRAEGLNFGLWLTSSSPWPSCLLSFVPFDLDHLAALLPTSIGPEDVLVLARQLSVGPIPTNAWSFTLRRTILAIRAIRPRVRMLLTYVDPNLSFSGAVYRAANWFLFGFEPKQRYLFLDGEHVTNRFLISRYGTANYDELSSILGDRLSKTTQPLMPLELYGYYLNRKDRRYASAHCRSLLGAWSPQCPLTTANAPSIYSQPPLSDYTSGTS